VRKERNVRNVRGVKRVKKEKKVKMVGIRKLKVWRRADRFLMDEVLFGRM
jgi:hypothetical protein